MPSVARALLEIDERGRPRADGGDVLLDELRAALRDLARFPREEVRRLQAELDRFAASRRSEARDEPVDPDEPHWRRWSMKP